MNDIEPTHETIVWICKNAEQAWQEGDPKKLQFWEDQKKEFEKKCYQRIESLVKQKTFLQQQQEVLIQKVRNGDYSPEEANRINQQIYEHSEDLNKQIQFYRNLLQYSTDEVDFVSNANDESNIFGESLENKVPFQKVIPIERYFYELFLSFLRVVFLSNIGQITICFFILVAAVYFTWTWNTRDQKPQFEYIPIHADNKHVIRILNKGMLNAKIYLTPTYPWELAPYIYFIVCSAETTTSQQKTDIQIPLNCLYTANGITSPITSTYIEISPGSEKSFEMDTQCIKQNFPDITKITLTIRTLFFRTQVLKVDIDLPSNST
ncbi:MAG TPA: hypothetical protein PLA12_09820 [Candidatus Hydrogenedens sp.]|nr:hypothetical protein [Candidatus Hydrogenedens sp.]